MRVLTALAQMLRRPKAALPATADAAPHTAPATPPKVFGIGLSKTGTTTLAACFGILDMGRHCSYRPELFPPLMAGDWEAVRRITDAFDTFEDAPWFAAYAYLRQAYPDAKFILTRRSSGQAWVRSAFSHRAQRAHEGQNQLGARLFAQLFPDTAPDDFHDTHTARVRACFADEPHRLLEVCWEEGHGWDELCAFLGKPMPGVPFPHENRGAYPSQDPTN